MIQKEKEDNCKKNTLEILIVKFMGFGKVNREVGLSHRILLT